jgi:outer membrane protein
MTNRIAVLCVIALLAVTCGEAAADSIKGRLGVTGRVGFVNPSNSDLNGFRRDSDLGFIGGGGFIYGITDDIAVDLEITHTGYSAEGAATAKNDFDTTSISLGGQYRFRNLPIAKLVPYGGIGLDILLNDIDALGLSVDNTAGIHVKGGVDYFVRKELAFTGEVKGILSPDADIHDAAGRKVGNFDPTSLVVTFGVRYFFN